ncbi:hypothetical protein RFI_08719 [Reticulomyxa filosa]|uniref:Guanylate cyclase domain-containing protein n=1 Tax=Reticulomyxa filosa TaxID=46433 RepID=X6NR00_RETFI|nr:hypothetical protein RFI_08719 [Reticulomyxa filosa]|eukprot:ETO28411.1 hypothetical protein RFI_08719 [Reticulomyxa filosa]
MWTYNYDKQQQQQQQQNGPGDALVCMWPPPDNIISDEEEQRKPERIEETLQRVIQCALDIQEKFGEVQLEGAATRDRNPNESNNAENGPQPLRVKLGIGVGTCGVLVVGGVKNRCEYLVTGEAFAQAFQCEADCLPKQVVVSSKAAQLMQNKFKMEPVGKNGNQLIIKRSADKISKNQIVQKTMDAQLVDVLKSYIPSAVVPHLLMPSLLWAAELRQVTIMFLSLPFNSKKLQVLDNMLVNHVNMTIRALQEKVYLYQGSLNKFLVDDKGSTVMAIFGLPPVAHVNDPERAVLTAMELQTELSQLFTAHYKEDMLKYEEDLKLYEKHPVGEPPIKPLYKTQAAIG